MNAAEATLIVVGLALCAGIWFAPQMITTYARRWALRERRAFRRYRSAVRHAQERGALDEADRLLALGWKPFK